MSDVNKILAELVDLAGSEPVTFISKHVAGAIQRQRLERAGEALRRKMSGGKPWAFRDDQVASLVFDYLRAAEDGTAVENLERMAELIANGVAEPGLTEEAVRHLMKILASLSYDEMRALAALIRAERRVGRGDGDQDKRGTEIYQAAWKDLAGEHAERPDDDTYSALAALQRTGLVVPGITFGGAIFTPTPLLGRLASLIDFQAPGSAS